LERRTGWVTRFFGRKAAAKVEPGESDAELPQAAPARKPVFPWLVRKPAHKTISPAAAKTKTASPVPAAPVEPKPAPDKPASTESAIDALRKARERAQRRTDKDR
jgi:hypothetical protein